MNIRPLGPGDWPAVRAIYDEGIAGFRILGVREGSGKMNGRWRGALLMERRSGVAGVD